MQQLCDFSNASQVKENWELSNEEKISMATSVKEKGTKYFKVCCKIH